MAEGEIERLRADLADQSDEHLRAEALRAQLDAMTRERAECKAQNRAMAETMAGLHRAAPKPEGT